MTDSSLPDPRIDRVPVRNREISDEFITRLINIGASDSTIEFARRTQKKIRRQNERTARKAARKAAGKRFPWSR